MCVKSGAKEDSIQTIPDEVPLSYLPGLAVRIIMKAIGELDLKTITSSKKDSQSLIDAGDFVVEHEVEPFIEKIIDLKEEDLHINVP